MMDANPSKDSSMPPTSARTPLSLIACILAALVLTSCSGSQDSAQNAEAPGDTLPSRTVELRTEVYDTAEATDPLPVDAQVPAVTVHRVNGEPVNLAQVVNDGATLVFYRGGW